MRLVILSNCAKILTLLPCYLNEKEIFLQIFTQLRSNLYLSFLFFCGIYLFFFFFPLSICDCSAKLPLCQINMYIFFLNLDRNIYREMLYYSFYSYLNITNWKKIKFAYFFNIRKFFKLSSIQIWLGKREMLDN